MALWSPSETEPSPLNRLANRPVILRTAAYFEFLLLFFLPSVFVCVLFWAVVPCAVLFCIPKNPPRFGVGFLCQTGGWRYASLPLVASPPRTTACGYITECYSPFVFYSDNRYISLLRRTGFSPWKPPSTLKPTRFGVGFGVGGGWGIRTLVGLHPNGFQDRLVMTASISLRAKRLSV